MNLGFDNWKMNIKSYWNKKWIKQNQECKELIIPIEKLEINNENVFNENLFKKKSEYLKMNNSNVD